MKQFQDLLKKSQQDIEKYIEIITIWQKHVNLISINTLKDIRERHILDSAQLFDLIPEHTKVLMDVGSGGGFPGIVLGILNKNAGFPIQKIYLVESDIKKATFLQEVNRQLKLNITVLNERIEKIKDVIPDVITARAFAELGQILTFCQSIVSRETLLILPKGKRVDEEIKNNKISCKINKLKSITDEESCILKVSEVSYEN